MNKVKTYCWLFGINLFISAFTFGGGYVVIPMIKKYYVEYESAAKAARILGESLEETYRKVYTKIHDLSKMQDY